MRSIYLSALSEWWGGQTVARVGMGRIGWYTIGGPGRVARQGGVARLGHGWVGGSGQGGVTGRCAGWIGKKRVLTTVEEHTRVFNNFNIATLMSTKLTNFPKMEIILKKTGNQSIIKVDYTYPENVLPTIKKYSMS